MTERLALDNAAAQDRMRMAADIGPVGPTELGFGGAMTHPRATKLRELAATLPLDSIVLETDAPDIPPEWLGRGRNEPGELPRIAAVLAELRGIDVDEAIVATSANARAVIRRLA